MKKSIMLTLCMVAMLSTLSISPSAKGNHQFPRSSAAASAAASARTATATADSRNNAKHSGAYQASDDPGFTVEGSLGTEHALDVNWPKRIELVPDKIATSHAITMGKDERDTLINILPRDPKTGKIVVDVTGDEKAAIPVKHSIELPGEVDACLKTMRSIKINPQTATMRGVGAVGTAGVLWAWPTAGAFACAAPLAISGTLLVAPEAINKENALHCCRNTVGCCQLLYALLQQGFSACRSKKRS